MARTRYTRPSKAELAALARLKVVDDAMRENAEKGAQHAASIAPVETGAYRSKFRVQEAGGEVRVVNDDPGAAAIEFGTEDTEAHNVLSKTADWLEGGA